jgi:hypothetical protein
LRIAEGNLYAGRWVASNKVLLSNGNDAAEALRGLPRCSND